MTNPHPYPASSDLTESLMADIKRLEEGLSDTKKWAWELHEHLSHRQCGDGCNGCPVCVIPDAACDELEDELLDAQGDVASISVMKDEVQAQLDVVREPALEALEWNWLDEDAPEGVRQDLYRALGLDCYGELRREGEK